MWRRERVRRTPLAMRSEPTWRRRIPGPPHDNQAHTSLRLRLLKKKEAGRLHPARGSGSEPASRHLSGRPVRDEVPRSALYSLPDAERHAGTRTAESEARPSGTASRGVFPRRFRSREACISRPTRFSREKLTRTPLAPDTLHFIPRNDPLVPLSCRPRRAGATMIAMRNGHLILLLLISVNLPPLPVPTVMPHRLRAAQSARATVRAERESCAKRDHGRASASQRSTSGDLRGPATRA